MKVIKSIIVEWSNLQESLPPHLQKTVDAWEAKKKKFNIRDVTPKGYGPNPDEGVDYTKQRMDKLSRKAQKREVSQMKKQK